MMTEAEQLFNKIFYGLLDRWRIIWSFRKVSENLISSGETNTYLQMSDIADEYLSSPEFDEIYIDKEKFVKSVGGKAGLANSLYQERLNDYRFVYSASCIVFAYSILDSCAYEACEVIAYQAPESFEEDVKNRKSLKNLANQKHTDKYQLALISEVWNYLKNEVERHCSLKNKIKLLFRICEPTSELLLKRKYEESNLKRLTEIRNALVHSSVQLPDILKVRNDLDFLFETCQLIVDMLMEKFGLRIDPYWLQKNSK
jgi:hypothetical protein